MLRFKYIFKDDSVFFGKARYRSDSHIVFEHARTFIKNNCFLKQIDIYEETKLIASVYG